MANPAHMLLLVWLRPGSEEEGRAGQDAGYLGHHGELGHSSADGFQGQALPRGDDGPRPLQPDRQHADLVLFGLWTSQWLDDR